MELAKGLILVKPEAHSREVAGLYFAEKYKRTSSKGVVVMVSEIQDEFDSCNIGDEIIYGRYEGYEIEIDGDRFHVIENTDVACILNESKYKIPYNFVLVRTTDKMGVSGDGNWMFDISFHRERFAHTFAEVVSPPDKLVFCKEFFDKEYPTSDFTKAKINSFSLGMGTKENLPEVKSGDIIHFHYLSIEDAAVNGRVVRDDETGDDLYLIRYDNCYAREREGNLGFINGFIGVRIESIPTVEEATSGLVKLNLDEKKLKNWGWGRIEYISEPNIGYSLYDADESKIPVKIGDYVNFKASKKMQIGNDVLLKNENLKGVTLIQRKDINFVVN